LVKADLGTKRACPSCNARFYDLEKRPIECPKCGFSYEPEALFKQRRRQPEPAGVIRAQDTEDEEEDEDEAESEEDEEEEAVEEAPLNVAATGEDEEEEEAAEEEPETAEGMSVVEGDEAEIEDIEVEDDEDDEDDDDLLGEVEDEEDDVSGIIDADIGKDEA
jgi:uncharacterized protein (TIGR02300 family)